MDFVRFWGLGIFLMFVFFIGSVIVMVVDICEVCGLGIVMMDFVYGILVCDNCGWVFDDVEMYLGFYY